MHPSGKYRRRVMERAWLETRTFWNVSRWLGILGQAMFAIVLFEIRHPRGTSVTSQDVLINAGGGALLGIALSFIFNLFLAPKLIDDDRAREIDDLSKCKTELQEQLQGIRGTPAISEWERGQRELVAEKLGEFTEAECAVLLFMAQHGKADRRSLGKRFDLELADRTIRKAIEAVLVHEGPKPYQYSVNEQFTDALRFVLR